MWALCGLLWPAGCVEWRPTFMRCILSFQPATQQPCRLHDVTCSYLQHCMRSPQVAQQVCDIRGTARSPASHIRCNTERIRLLGAAKTAMHREYTVCSSAQ